MDNSSKAQSFNKLNNLYHDPKSDLFLLPNTAKLYAAAKTQAALSNLTIDDISIFKQQVESISRTTAEKRLRAGIARYSFRPYRFFNHNIVAGDLAFIPRLTKPDSTAANKNRPPGILAVFMDCQSRLVSLNFQQNAKAETTLKTFEKSLKEDFVTGGRQHKFTHFLSDRGSEFKVQYGTVQC